MILYTYGTIIHGNEFEWNTFTGMDKKTPSPLKGEGVTHLLLWFCMSYLPLF